MCPDSFWLEGSKAEESRINGVYDMVYVGDSPLLRRGSQVWKHEIENIYLSVSSRVVWQFNLGDDFDKDSIRTCDIYI